MQRNPLALSAVPPMIKWLLIANGIGFLAKIYAPALVIFNFALWPLGSYSVPGTDASVGFAPWQLVSYAFLHADIAHLFFNMFALWMFGRVLEQVWGDARFLLYYAICIVGAGVTQFIVVSFVTGGPVVPTIGASGGVFGILLAFGLMFPDARVMLIIPPIPMKAKYFVLGYGVLELFFGVTGTEAGIAHFAHLGGMLFGFIVLMIWRQQGRLRN
ncbi:rhomboid family intramembrane serine protease [Salinisphaera sp. Q1T1-3]|uniref:rhomboid family intramembrane serine protease n=1 Tax=Salinisphaera sp. Q1T1-3 TaxID=2321229 RepID=UPI000E7581C8|nr:rhomboid family intramembrane serine protease [Salinisphaera sp. Q1T1-3]RJS92941.1 rhomboid family intramembrane serine protease [Salinisphaera sp. Q1T1-3]